MRLAAVLLCLSAGACTVSIDYSGSGFRCERTADCPGDQVCVEGRCGEPGGLIDAGPGVDAGPAPRLVDAVIGDRLFLDFNDPADHSVFTDKSRRRRDAERSNQQATVGHFGAGFAPMTGEVVEVFDDPGLSVGPNGITIEAWLDFDGGVPFPVAIYGDNQTLPPLATEYTLFFRVNGGAEIALAVMDGCAGPIVTAGVPFSLGAFAHVAVTWDRLEAVFYLDGVVLGRTPLVAAGCIRAEAFHVGRTGNGNNVFSGVIDELKVSARVKSAAEIVESMNHDSSAAADCGNYFLEAGETCDVDSFCCDISSCRYRADGTSCAGQGSCSSGVCAVPGARDESEAIALYSFAAAPGGVVADSSPSAINLNIDDLGAVVSEDGGLRFSTASGARSASPTSAIADPVAASGEMTIEAWVTPENTTQSGPARIVTHSVSTVERSFTLGQTATRVVARFRGLDTTPNGVPELVSPVGALVAGELHHIVATRASDGRRRLFVNGRLVAESTVLGPLVTDAAYPLLIANEATSDRPFLGTYFRVAIYPVAFDEARVAAHFAVGP